MLPYDIPYFIAPSVLIVEGATQLLLFDTERKESFLLPLQLKSFLNNENGRTLEESMNSELLPKDDFIRFVSFLSDNDLIYFSSNYKLYKPVETKYDYPSGITNTIVDINDGHFSQLIVDNLDAINCFHLQIRYYRKVDIVELTELFELLDSLFLKSLELALIFDDNLSENLIAEAISRKVYVDAIICYQAKEEKRSKLVPSGQLLYYTEQQLNITSCGVVSPGYFTSNILAFSESLAHNSCLNRKISIDINGDIKNCPSMPTSFGNINDTTLAEVLKKPSFKELWDISKDKIHVCKDCEFRYVCTDCRAYIEDPNDIYSKPLKCGYNPYIGEWSEWSDNPLKQNAIRYYGLDS